MSLQSTSTDAQPRLLLLRCDRLGDTVLALPAAVALRAALPDAHIAFCCRPENAPLVALVEGIDEVIPWAPEAGTAELRPQLASFDGAAMLLPKPPALAWALWRSGVRVRVGSARRWWAPLFNQRVGGSRRSGGLHESEQNTRLALALAAAFGGAEPAAQAPLPRLRFSQGLQEQATAALNAAGLASGSEAAPFVILHGGSRGSAKDWPLERMLELAARLVADGCQVGWTVGPVDQAVQAAIHAQLGTAAHFIVAPPLDVLAALLARAACVVANSTGPLHVAALAGAPVLGLYPPVRACTPDRWGPLGPRSRSIVAPLLADEPDPIPNPAAAPEDLMTRISVDQVYEQVRAQLGCAP